MVGVLHTWTRALIYHPHVHYVVPGGGLVPDGKAWHPAREDFLLPVRALSVLFRAKFRDALRKTELFAEVPPEAWAQDWVVHCQPVGNGAGALKYLAPYIFRVAISNKRILSLEDDQVTFGYTDGRSGQRKTCTVSAEEFIRRFLQHVPPKGLHRVRTYGLLHPVHRSALQRVRLFATPSPPAIEESTHDDDPHARQGLRCPKCGHNSLTLGRRLSPRECMNLQAMSPRGRAPP